MSRREWGFVLMSLGLLLASVTVSISPSLGLNWASTGLAFYAGMLWTYRESAS